MIQACQSWRSVSWAINSWQTSNKMSCDHFPHFREEKKVNENHHLIPSCSFNWGKVFTCDRHRWRLKASCPAFLPRHRKVFDEYVRLEPVRRKGHGFSKWFFGEIHPITPPVFLLFANVQMHLGKENHSEIWVGCKKRNLSCKKTKIFTIFNFKIHQPAQVWILFKVAADVKSLELIGFDRRL